MFPYRVKYNESEYHIQNNNLLFEIDQTYQNILDLLRKNRKYQTNQICILLFM